MRQFFPSILLLSISGQGQQEETTTVQKPSALLTALSIYEDRSPRTKRQCGIGGCGGGCGRSYGCGGGGCRGGGCGGYGGYSGGCRGSGCGGGCANPCGARGRLCCDNVAPRPCVGCGLNRGVFPEPLPISVGVDTCCACCMPTCAPRCINLGGCGSCGGYGGGYDYFDYFG